MWDDHDFGKNDGGKEWQYKKEMRPLFLDFVGEPKDTERRLESDTGLYQDYFIDHVNMNTTTHIILLDNRYEFVKGDRLGPS